uniref:Ras association domain family member 8b n=1 Tax=Salmo trutta TaxID=8032 RepID=A0A674DTJ4_SALTR
MELKVWVDGVQRIVCGVTELTTCQEVVIALAQAIGRTGRYTLIERWRETERHLAPHENPVVSLNMWGQYASDVQLVLQRTGPSLSERPNSDGTSRVPERGLYRQNLHTLGILSTSFTWNAFPTVLKEFPHMLSTCWLLFLHSAVQLIPNHLNWVEVG